MPTLKEHKVLRKSIVMADDYAQLILQNKEWQISYSI